MNCGMEGFYSGMGIMSVVDPGEICNLDGSGNWGY